MINVIFLKGTYAELMEREEEFAQLMNIYQTEEEEENAEEAGERGFCAGAPQTTRPILASSKKSISFESKDGEQDYKPSSRNRRMSRKFERSMSREEEQEYVKRQISTNKNKKLVSEEEVAIGILFLSRICYYMNFPF